MSDYEDHDFDQAAAGEGVTHSALASEVKKGDHLVIDDHPCKIVQLSVEGGKVHIIGVDIFTGKKEELSVTADASVDIPSVQHNEYLFSYVEDDMLHLSTFDGDEKNDVPVPEGGTGDRIRDYEGKGSDIIVTIMSSMGKQAAIAVREGS